MLTAIKACCRGNYIMSDAMGVPAKVIVSRNLWLKQCAVKYDFCFRGSCKFTRRPFEIYLSLFIL